MSDKKHIDRLFQEKLKDFEATPDAAVWDELSQKLGHKQKNRRIVPLWLQLTGIAAGLVLMFVVGKSLISSDDNKPNEEILVEQEDNSIPSEVNNDALNQNNFQSANDVVVDNENKGETTTSDVSSDETEGNKNSNLINVKKLQNNTVVNQTPNNNRNRQQLNKSNNSTETKTNATVATNNKTNSNLSQDSFNKNVINQEKSQELIKENEADANVVVGTTNSSEEKNSENNILEEGVDANKVKTEEALAAVDEAEKEETTSDIEKAIEEQNKEEEATVDEELNKQRWSVAPNIAPVYFNTLGSGSSIDNQFTSNNKSGNINMSYGVAVGYKLNDKLSVRGGINRLDIGYNTNDVIVYNNIDTDVDTPPLKNVRMNSQGQTLSFLSADGLNFAQVPSVVAQNVTSSIDQELGFIEIPLELTYNISDKKLGVDLIGGFSTLFLNKNEVYGSLQGERTLLGEATNISQTSFSANVGVGLNYKVSEKVNLKLEPTFKYQLNTFSDTSGDFNPFVLGVYTGFSFKF